MIEVHVDVGVLDSRLEDPAVAPGHCVRSDGANHVKAPAGEGCEGRWPGLRAEKLREDQTRGTGGRHCGAVTAARRALVNRDNLPEQEITSVISEKKSIETLTLSLFP